MCRAAACTVPQASSSQLSEGPSLARQQTVERGTSFQLHMHINNALLVKMQIPSQQKRQSPRFCISKKLLVDAGLQSVVEGIFKTTDLTSRDSYTKRS